MKPGEVITKNEEINLNKDSKVTKIKISNSGDRPVQVGSHYHFFETNEYLVFDRKLSYGKRLNIPSGTAVRFEPGQSKDVELIEINGLKKYTGSIRKLWVIYNG
jgi:urease subunit beta